MNVNIHIDRLILDEVSFHPREAFAFQLALERALSEGIGQFGPETCFDHLETPVASLQVSPRATTADLAGHVAGVVSQSFLARE